MKVNLNEVEEAIDQVSDDFVAWYYIPEERILYEDKQDPSQNEIDFEKEQKNLIPLPDRHEVDDYDNMESFISTVKDLTAAEWLSNAIHGRGAFRMFRATCQRFGLLNDWYDYRQACHRTLAEEWCDENGLLYEEADRDEGYEESEETESVKEAPAPKKENAVRIVSVNAKNYMSALETAACYLDWNQQTNDNDFERAQVFLEEALKTGKKLFCSVEKGRYTGIAIISSVNLSEDLLECLCVLNAYRRKGIGTSLLEGVLQQSKDAGKQLLLRIPYERQECLGFFSKNGFQPVYLELQQK